MLNSCIKRSIEALINTHFFHLSKNLDNLQSFTFLWNSASKDNFAKTNFIFLVSKNRIFAQRFPFLSLHSLWRVATWGFVNCNQISVFKW